MVESLHELLKEFLVSQSKSQVMAPTLSCLMWYRYRMDDINVILFLILNGDGNVPDGVGRR